jgi:hypothetical protein
LKLRRAAVLVRAEVHLLEDSAMSEPSRQPNRPTPPVGGKKSSRAGSDSRQPRVNPLFDDEGEYRMAREPPKPPPLPEPAPPLEQYSVPVWLKERTLVSAAEKPPPPPRWPMISGNLTFPFYFNALSVLLLVSLGLVITGWLVMFWIEYGAVLGGTSARLLGLPPVAVGLLTLGYAAACCFIIIESTANGWDTFPISPGFDWREYAWHFFHIGVLALQAGFAGAAAQFACDSNTALPLAVGTLVAFPFVLLGSLAAQYAWVPLAIGTVLRSVIHVPLAWLLFYVQTSVLIWVMTLLTLAGLESESPWLTPTYAAPLLAFVIVFYARLIGRLAGCIAAKMDTLTPEDDDDES